MIIADMNEINETANYLKAIDRSSNESVQRSLDISARSRKSMFPWRGQFSPQLIEFIIGEYRSENKAFHIFDPFCGSGTALAEAARHQLSATGFDLNPAAYLFSSMHGFANRSIEMRREIIAETRDRIGSASLSLFSSPRQMHPSEAILNSHGLERSLFAVSLMLSMKNQNDYSPLNHETSFKEVVKTVLAMPESDAPLTIEMRDSRSTNLMDESINLIITSPPYINVFNYHQNYRPALELMGWKPLAIAAAEIGANRKHRQNRFLTVIQYCIDISLILRELNRIIKSDGMIVFVIGRCSNVRGASFNNGLLVGLVARLSGMKIDRWRERKFLNRFGQDIYEDLPYFRSTDRSISLSKAMSLGRAVGLWALERAILDCDADVRDDISAAIKKAPDIQPSPNVIIDSPTLSDHPSILRKDVVAA